MSRGYESHEWLDRVRTEPRGDKEWKEEEGWGVWTDTPSRVIWVPQMSRSSTPSQRTLAQLAGSLIAKCLITHPAHPCLLPVAWWVNFLLPGAVLLRVVPSCNRQLPRQIAGGRDLWGNQRLLPAALHRWGDGITAQACQAQTRSWFLVALSSLGSCV